ncbi:D-Ala-D-Ala carboxypeptidase family metallohydrolase [Castellaniella hirudinis]|uniref:D-Ala-D-Ala carboxypeptidase family metallohydrolase n=1 Tax=Castellaniella hirudinis TaxID=1144617 RepID=UPI0039C33AF5
MQLTQHFALAEFTRSDTARRLGVDNTPTRHHLANLHVLAVTLEGVRALLGHPIIITSGYRSPALNAAVDGSATSSHCEGLAADFHCPGFGPDQAVAQAIADSALEFDQLIFEQTRTHWVHLGVGDRMRREVLSWRSGRGYQRGIVVIA